MTLTIEVSGELEAALNAQAAQQGLTADKVARLVLASALVPGPGHAEVASIAHLQKTNPEEWLRQFRAWAESHDRTTALLSDEALSRESIYPDRI